MSTAADSTLPDVTDTDAWITCKDAARTLGCVERVARERLGDQGRRTLATARRPTRFRA